MSTKDKVFGSAKRRVFVVFAFVLALVLTNVPPAQAAVTANVYIDWGQTQRTITNELYGIGLYGGVSPNIATQSTYKSNLSYFKPGVVRFHYAGLTNSSATDERGWVDVTNKKWDEARIKTVMDAIDSLNTSTYGNYRPAKMVNIPDFPSWMKKVSYTVGNETIQLLDPTEYDNYAAFCAQLVTILKNQGRNVKYYTPTNERDDIYYVKWKNAGLADKLDELITIYNKAAVAMKQADPTIKVGGLEFARGDLVDQVRRFVRGAKSNLDFVAYHFYANGDPYASNESVYNRTQDAARHGLDIVNIVNQEGLNIPVFDTEFNINYAGQQDYKQTLSSGAVYDSLVWVGAIDNNQPATAGWNDRDGYYGKLNNDANNSIRVGAHNMQMFNNYMTGDRVTSTSDNGAIVTLATKTSSRKSIAIINRSGSSQTVKLNFAPAWSTSSNFSRYVVAPAPAYYYTGSISYANATNGNLIVEADSVTVLTVNDSQAVTSNSTELSRTGWTASASNSSSSNPPSSALDNNGGTRWATGTRQASGQWFQVDLGASRTFDRIVLDAGGSKTDFPRRYEVYATDNPSTLGSPLVTGAGIAVNGSTYGTGGGVSGSATTIYFAPQTKRYIRVVIKTGAGENWWGINEFRVYKH
jgi:xylan 1,4-beta-xylosidase